MTPSQPSPRPWKSDSYLVVDANGKYVANCHSREFSGPFVDDEANAALIIEAVNGHGVVSDEMVSAAAASMFNAMGADYEWDDATDSDVNFWMPVARAALVAALAARGGGA